ncbi:uncharacterized protein [Magallana gigas]|uniref:uncharacterized protein n=1 Tax=Magallana gigas TaxID=29159 RepID=UPI0033420D8E
MCDNCTLLTNECGGDSAYNVFYTDSTDLKIPSHRLSLQCQNDPRFVNTSCNQFLPPLCNIKPSEKLSINDKLSKIWKDGMEFCKIVNNGFYLLGNITLIDARSACMGLQNSGPGWIGIIKENFEKLDQGHFINKPYPAFFNTCQTCSSKKQKPLCEYIQCNQSLTPEIFCSENAIILQPDTKDSSVTETVVPVVLVLILLGSCAVIFLIYIRRKKKSQGKQTNSRNVLPRNNGKNTSNKNDGNQMDRNYFVLQQSNSTYQLADNSKIQSESPYNEAVDGTYDRLGDKDARKIPANDIYNHASSGGLSDLSDYDVANRKNESSEDHTYDSTGVKDDSFGNLKSDQSDYVVANRKHLNKENNTYDHAGVMDNSYGKLNLSQFKETDYSELS